MTPSPLSSCNGRCSHVYLLQPSPGDSSPDAGGSTPPLLLAFAPLQPPLVSSVGVSLKNKKVRTSHLYRQVLLLLLPLKCHLETLEREPPTFVQPPCYCTA